MLERVKGPVPVFVKVAVCGALVFATFTFPKLRLVVDRLTMGAVPVPVRLAVCGLPAALSVTATLALRLPVAVGVNVTLMVQLELAASELPQLFVCAKSPLLVPVTAMLEILNAVPPEFVSMTA